MIFNKYVELGYCLYNFIESQNYVEFQNFGWNPLTVSFLATMVFALAGSVGFIIQNEIVWHNESGKSISLPYFISGFFLFIGSFLYGYYEYKFAMIFSGVVRSLPLIPLLIGLKKFRGFNKGQKQLFGLYSLAIVLMIVLPYKGIMIVVIACGIVMTTALQPLEMWREKKKGDVSLILFLINATSTGFWIIYSIYVKDMPILIFSIFFEIFFLTTIVLWIMYWIRERLIK